MKRAELIAEFTGKLSASFQDGTFARLMLTAPVPGAAQRVIGRLIELAGQPHLSLTYRYPTKDVTKNLPVTGVLAWANEELTTHYRGARLCTTRQDWQLTPKRIIAHPPTLTTLPPRTHDRTKPMRLDASAEPWLHALGITPKKRQQIERYLELVSHLTAELPIHTVVDMGCGKGYLTFALWHLLRCRVIGIDQRPDLVNAANDLARQLGATSLEFVTGTIQSAPLPPLDALIALHACDTATDDAIRRGIAAGAKLIVVAPCCHKQLRPQLGRPSPLAPVLAHGLMAERLAEWATDALRALHLEAAGYRVKIIEFVESEHTPKNLMIAAIRVGTPTGREAVAAFKNFFGIRHHALD